MKEPYKAPSEELKVSAVATKEPVNAEVKTAPVPQQPETITPALLYSRSIDKFVEFLAGRLSFNSKEDRNKVQREFIKCTEDFMNASYETMSETLEYMVKVIVENPDLFADNRILAPVYDANDVADPTKRMSKDTRERYEAFMLFIISYATNIKNKARFFQQFDVKYFASRYPERTRANIIDFVNH